MEQLRKLKPASRQFPDMALTHPGGRCCRPIVGTRPRRYVTRWRCPKQLVKSARRRLPICEWRECDCGIHDTAVHRIYCLDESLDRIVAFLGTHTRTAFYRLNGLLGLSDAIGDFLLDLGDDARNVVVPGNRFDQLILKTLHAGDVLIDCTVCRVG